MHPFVLLAEPVRRRIVEVLASGEHSAGELADVVTHEFRVSRSAASHHLKVLREQQFVEFRLEGASHLYRLQDNALDRLELELDHLRTLWDVRSGWPYRTDPLRPTPHRARGRGNRGNSVADVWGEPASRPSVFAMTGVTTPDSRTTPAEEPDELDWLFDLHPWFRG